MAGTITRENVEAMIKIIGQPGDFDIHEPTDGSNYSYGSKKRLYRNPDERIISGVCGGIGSYLNIDPVWVRLIFILLTFTFGVGFLVYIALWIALPVAFTDSQKRELYGESFHSEAYKNQQMNDYVSAGSNGRVNASTSNVGNAFNEIFSAIGKFFFIIIRIFTIAFGVLFVITGFTALLVFILLLFVKNPGFLPAEIHANFFYLPDFLDFVVNPSLTSWICILLSLVVVLPLLAIIYWGIKMIFWFRSRDGVISLIALVAWVMSLTALVIIFAGQGLSFSERGRVTSNYVIEKAPATLYIVTDKKISDLKYNRELNIYDDDYSMFADIKALELSIRTKLNFIASDDKSARIEVIKMSSGSSRNEAIRRAESIPYNYRISNDTLYLDEYFTLPKDHKWSGDEIHATLYLPEGSIIRFDRGSHILFRGYYYDQDEIGSWEPGKYNWVMTEEGLKKTESIINSNK